MDSIKVFVVKHGLLLGLVALAASLFVGFASKSHDMQSIMSSQNLAIAGLALMVVGRKP